jgi:hypothetical protein
VIMTRLLAPVTTLIASLLLAPPAVAKRHIVGPQTDNDGRPIYAASYQGVDFRKSGRDRRAQRETANRSASLSVHGLVGPLAQKANEIVFACSSRVVSAFRHTRIAGTRHMSLHASGRAVDLQGNSGCIYRHLADWRGGYSTDYGRVGHVHVSLGGREDGLRFAHGGGPHKVRFAHR